MATTNSVVLSHRTKGTSVVSGKFRVTNPGSFAAPHDHSFYATLADCIKDMGTQQNRGTSSLFAYPVANLQFYVVG